MNFKYFNPNPDAKTFKSGKPKNWNRNDSFIRAICGATNKDWLEVFDGLVEIARESKDTIDSKNVIMEYLAKNNFAHCTYGKPGVGEQRPTIEDFMKIYSEGVYILCLRNYYICIIDGYQLNVNEIKNEKIYSYWKLSE